MFSLQTRKETKMKIIEYGFGIKFIQFSIFLKETSSYTEEAILAFLVLSLLSGIVYTATNFIQLVSPQLVDQFLQTKLCWKAPNKGYPHMWDVQKQQ